MICRSALMTTADIVDNGILDEQRDLASAYKMGAGHMNVSRAMDPGLVYEINERQYAAHVCSTLGEAALRAVSRNDSWRCSDLPTTHPSNLNYPSITVPLLPIPFTVVRTLMNVAPPGTPETYTARVVMPPAGGAHHHRTKHAHLHLHRAGGLVPDLGQPLQQL